MRTPNRWLIAVLSIPVIGLNAWLAWAIVTAPPPVFLLGAAASAVLAVLGVLGIVEFARRGSIQMSFMSIAGTAAWWALVIVFGLAAGGRLFAVAGQ